MTSTNLIQKTILSFVGPGIGGNIFILVRQIHTFVMGPEKKTIDFILIHLALSHAILICITGIRGVAIVYHVRNFLDSVGCKTVIYLTRVARGLSICDTCLLSVVQAITISPRTTLCRKLKPQTTRQVLLCLLLLLIFNFLVSSNLLHYITSVSSVNRTGMHVYTGYCYMLPSRETVRWLFLALMTLRDLIFQSLMACSSGYMALHLYKHHKRVLYLRSLRFANKASPEIRATLRILVLMACFLFFYWADFTFSFYIGSTLTHTSIILDFQILLGFGYAVLSPFVLMSSDMCVAKMLKC